MSRSENICRNAEHDYYCTRPKGHEGSHIAQGFGKRIVLVWDEDGVFSAQGSEQVDDELEEERKSI